MENQNQLVKKFEELVNSITGGDWETGIVFIPDKVWAEKAHIAIQKSSPIDDYKTVALVGLFDENEQEIKSPELDFILFAWNNRMELLEIMKNET